MNHSNTIFEARKIPYNYVVSTDLSITLLLSELVRSPGFRERDRERQVDQEVGERCHAGPYQRRFAQQARGGA